MSGNCEKDSVLRPFMPLLFSRSVAQSEGAAKRECLAQKPLFLQRRARQAGAEAGRFLLHRERYRFGWHRQHDIGHRLEVEVRYKAITHGEDAI